MDQESRILWLEITRKRGILVGLATINWSTNVSETYWTRRCVVMCQHLPLFFPVLGQA